MWYLQSKDVLDWAGGCLWAASRHKEALTEDSDQENSGTMPYHQCPWTSQQMDTPWACDYFPDLSLNFLWISSQRVSDVKQMLRCCEWEHCDGEEKESLKSIWRMLNVKTGSKRQEQAMLQWESLSRFWSTNDIFGRGQKVQRALYPRSSLEQDATGTTGRKWKCRQSSDMDTFTMGCLSRCPEAGNQKLKDLLLFKHLNNNMLLIRILPKHWELHWATDLLHCASLQRQVYGSL